MYLNLAGVIQKIDSLSKIRGFLVLLEVKKKNFYHLAGNVGWKNDRRCLPVRIANQIREVMPEAIERATDGGDMTMDVRSLYYAVRDIFLKRHHPEKSFYKEYDSFSQDFLPKYERETGGIGNLVRAPRGSIATPQFHGGDITSPPTPTASRRSSSTRGRNTPPSVRETK